MWECATLCGILILEISLTCEVRYIYSIFLFLLLHKTFHYLHFQLLKDMIPIVNNQVWAEYSLVWWITYQSRISLSVGICFILVNSVVFVFSTVIYHLDPLQAALNFFFLLFFLCTLFYAFRCLGLIT